MPVRLLADRRRRCGGLWATGPPNRGHRSPVAGETVSPALLGLLVFGDHTRPRTTPVAIAGFVAALAGAAALGQFGDVRQPDSPDPAGAEAAR
jgi:hypothetical protein